MVCHLSLHSLLDFDHVVAVDDAGRGNVTLGRGVCRCIHALRFAQLRLVGEDGEAANLDCSRLDAVLFFVHYACLFCLV